MKIPFGLRVADQHMVEPHEVENGLACGCICPGCQHKLEAKQGQKIEWHFAHAAGGDCAGAVESALHRMAKQLIVERGQLCVPPLVLRRQIQGPRGEETRQLAWQEMLTVTVQHGGLVDLSGCKQEVNLGERKPDIYALLDDLPIAVEVAFTHDCDAKKIAWFKECDLTAIEIDIAPPRDLTAGLARCFLESRLFGDATCSQWLHHGREAFGATRLDEMERELRESRKAFDEAFLRSEITKRNTREKREAFKQQIDELEVVKLHLGNLTLRLAYSELRATLAPSVMRYSRMSDEHWAALLEIAAECEGRWNERFKFFEFRRRTPLDANIVFLQLRSMLEMWIAGPPPPEDPPRPPQKPQQPVKRKFWSVQDQELFDELAAIKEYEGGLSREVAERDAYNETMQRQAAKQLGRAE